MKLMTILLGLSLLVTPALAAPKKPDAKPPCVTSEMAVKQLTEAGFKVEHNLSGDELTKLNRAAEKRGAKIPTDQTGLLFASHPKMEVLTGVVLIKGCVSQLFPMLPKILKELMNADDGSI